MVLAPQQLEMSMPHFTSQPEQVESNVPDIYVKTLEWILDGSNGKIIAETAPQMFFELIYHSMNNMKLLRCQKVVDLIKKIKNINMKKTE